MGHHFASPGTAGIGIDLNNNFCLIQFATGGCVSCLGQGPHFNCSSSESATGPQANDGPNYDEQSMITRPLCQKPE